MLRALFVLAAAAPLAAQSPQPPAGIPRDWPLLGQSQVSEGAKGMVVSGHPLASEAGRDVLRRGGNAVDAAVAVHFALQVVHPEAGNIGGGGFMVHREPGGGVHALDFRETAPAAGHRDMYLDSEGNPTDRSLTGHLAAGVPGSVAGLWTAHQKFGRLPWRELVEVSVRLARDGFVIDQRRHSSISGGARRLSRFAASARQYLPGGAPPPVGSTFRQPDLARTLEAIRDRGPDGFYRGWVADSIVAEMARGAGLITHQDLSGYKAVWREPVRLTYRGHTLYSMPPSSSGGITLGIILNILEGYGSLPGFGSAELLHLEAEAMRRAFIERNTRLGDPDFVKVPTDLLTSKEFAATLRGEIDPAKATPTPAFDPRVPGGESTTHYSIVDAEGGAVAITTTLNGSYGSAVTVSGAGFLLNNEMDDFATAPGRPNMYGLVQGEVNAVAPGKRMLSAMTPTIVLDPNGRLLMVVGTPGGPTIITQVYHVISNVIDHRMDLADAVAAPRMHHQALPDTIRLERARSGATGAAPDAVAGLQRLGHGVGWRGYMGDVQAIIRTPGGWQGVSDPRGGGGGAGW